MPVLKTVGFLYQNGWGVKQNYAEALRWYHKAADQGTPEAQHSIGVFYQTGQGVTQDYTEAMPGTRKRPTRDMSQPNTVLDCCTNRAWV